MRGMRSNQVHGEGMGGGSCECNISKILQLKLSPYFYKQLGSRKTDLKQARVTYTAWSIHSFLHVIQHMHTKYCIICTCGYWVEFPLAEFTSNTNWSKICTDTANHYLQEFEGYSTLFDQNVFFCSCLSGLFVCLPWSNSS